MSSLDDKYIDGLNYKIFFSNDTYHAKESSNDIQISKIIINKNIQYVSFALMIVGILILIFDYVIDIFNTIKGFFLLVKDRKKNELRSLKLITGINKNNFLRFFIGFGLIFASAGLFYVASKVTILTDTEMLSLLSNIEFVKAMEKARQIALKRMQKNKIRYPKRKMESVNAM